MLRRNFWIVSVVLAVAVLRNDAADSWRPPMGTRTSWTSSRRMRTT